MQTKSTKSTKSALQTPENGSTEIMFGQIDYLDSDTFVNKFQPATELINNPKWIKKYPNLNLYIRKSTFTQSDFAAMDNNKVDIESDDGTKSTYGDKNSEVCKFVLSFLSDKQINVIDPITYFEFDNINWIINGNTRYEMISYYCSEKGKNLGVSVKPIPVRRLEDAYVNPETLLSFQVQSNDVTRHQSMRAIAYAIRNYFDSLKAEGKLKESDIRKQTIRVFQHSLGTGQNANNKLSARLTLTELPEFILDLVETGKLADTTAIKLYQKHQTLMNDFEKAKKSIQGHTLEVFHQYVKEKVELYISTGAKSTRNNKGTLYSKTDVDNAYNTYLKEYLDDGNVTEVTLKEGETGDISDIPNNGEVKEVTDKVKVPEYTIENYQEMYDHYRAFSLPENNPTMNAKLLKILPGILVKIVGLTTKEGISFAPEVEEADDHIVRECLKLIQMYFPIEGDAGDEFIGCFPKPELDELIVKTGMSKLIDLIKDSKKEQTETEETFVAPVESKVEEVTVSSKTIETKPASKPLGIPVKKVAATDSFDLDL
ncbi:MAG: hypothetical protein F6K34_01180 [Okeania sp. SIO4D6]|uniref:hypothetical protein n=1 Tax=unclassified Okeania TaxID=2634635 RepID=UPI0013B95417|nr:MULTISPECIES: hypothetical protein [unclassified Okeania]NEP03542.1 hypothetical protein [Okeania sp. SIO4D6]NEP75717.1 hypothetical protein [Okeania sp. SIO2G5]NEP96594.1 hypothetical protein [Okeania sp. SIO2F5]